MTSYGGNGNEHVLALGKTLVTEMMLHSLASEPASRSGVQEHEWGAVYRSLGNSWATTPRYPPLAMLTTHVAARESSVYLTSCLMVCLVGLVSPPPSTEEYYWAWFCEVLARALIAALFQRQPSPCRVSNTESHSTRHLLLALTSCPLLSRCFLSLGGVLRFIITLIFSHFYH